MKYIVEASENQQKGMMIKPSHRSNPTVVPDELKKVLSKNTTLSNKFNDMSPSCRREYAEYISEAKKPETKQRRIDKIIPMINAMIGLNDKYKK